MKAKPKKPKKLKKSKKAVCAHCVTSEKRQAKNPRPLWAFDVNTVWRNVWAKRPRTFKVRGKTEAAAKVALADMLEDPYWRADGYTIARVRRVAEKTR